LSDFEFSGREPIHQSTANAFIEGGNLSNLFNAVCIAFTSAGLLTPLRPTD